MKSHVLFSIRAVAKMAITSLPAFNLHESGLNVIIYLQEIKRSSPVSRSDRTAVEIIHVETPVGANFHLFLVAFALPEGAVLEVTSVA